MSALFAQICRWAVVETGGGEAMEIVTPWRRPLIKAIEEGLVPPVDPGK
jgi:hypothetical protein